MNRITKEMCVVFTKDYYRSIPIIFSLLSVFVIAALGFYTRKLLVVGIAIAVFLALLVLLIYIIKRKIEKLNALDIYLVEDVVVKFKKRRNNGVGEGCSYIYTFKEHGRYTINKSFYPTIEIPLHKEKTIKHTEVDDLTVRSCEKGDACYLLVCNRNNRRRIIKCFCQYYFDPAKEDFDYIDGKYYYKRSEKS
ncbi:MAG: hypothetical protein IJB57_04800 [Clostridia bacterium]|nr:hypothetical protein [Clostridia bacterium]